MYAKRTFQKVKKIKLELLRDFFFILFFFFLLFFCSVVSASL